MRIALHPTSEVGIKAGRLLLGERDLETLGILGHQVIDRDARVLRIDDYSDFDVLVTDDPDPGIAEEAIAAGVPVVTWVDDGRLDLANVEVAVMTGANLATGIAGALAAREAAGEPGAILVAWTEPGKSLRTGEPVTFPDPVGARWGKVRDRHGTMTEVVVAVPDEWAGVVVKVTAEGTTRILGIADLAGHLESIALTAGAVTMAGGSHQPGRLVPGDVADDYLLAALRAGLDVASFTAAT
jgi:hypothetical protein